MNGWAIVSSELQYGLHSSWHLYFEMNDNSKVGGKKKKEEKKFKSYR